MRHNVGSALHRLTTRVAARPTPSLISWYLIAVGAGVGVLWAASLPGTFHDGLFTYAGTPTAGNIPGTAPCP